MRLCSNCRAPLAHAEQRCPACLHLPERFGGILAFAPERAEDDEGFKADYFARLAEVEAGSFWFRARNQLIIWALRRYFPDAKNFLEIGCGTGFVLAGIRKALPALVVSGSEIFRAGLSFAVQRLPESELFQMDARRIPFKEEFDVIGAFDVLEHVKEDEEVLSQMYEATRTGGGIIVTVPHHPFLWNAADDFSRHARRYKARELRDKVRRAGFDVLRVTSFVSLVLPLLLLSRLKQRFDTEYDPLAEFNINPLVDTTLERILDGERAMIRAGVSFPAGGSLLLVARRD